MFEAPVIDNLDFARQGARISGQLEVTSLTRLHDDLADTLGNVSYSLTGSIGQHGEYRLTCSIAANLKLVCQRCLQPMAWPVSVESQLLIGEEPQEWAEVDDGPEFIPANAHMDVRALIEDELLLAMPLAPRHEPGDCQGKESAPAQAKSRAFAQLGELMRQRHNNDTKE